MEVECQNKKLLQLYNTGRSTKKYRLPSEVVDKFLMRIEALDSAKNIHDLWNHSALKFEKLKGGKNKYSLRLNKQYRLEVSIDWTNEDKTVGRITVLDISNHYD